MKIEILVPTFWCALSLVVCGASAEFDAAFKEACSKLDSGEGKEKPGLIVPALVEDLKKVGTEEDILEAIAGVWADPSRKSEWSQVSSLQLPLGPGADRTKIVSAMRDNLPEIFKVGTPRTAMQVAVGFLVSYGSPADAEAVKPFIEEVKSKEPGFGQGLELTLQAAQDSRRLLANAQTREPESAHVQNPPTKKAVSPSLATQATDVGEIRESSHGFAWMAGIATILVVSVVLFVSLKKRQA
jgi:hypothetical protein